MSPIKTYLDNQPISSDNAEIERIARKSRMYHLIDRVLYKQDAIGMMMKVCSYFRRFTAEYAGRTHHGAP
jgi:hypothetical protein